METTTGPLGQGVATSVGMAIASRWQAQLLQPAGLRHVRLRRLRALRRRLHDGGRLRRGGLAGRSPAAVQPLLDLRQQQDHDRGPHRVGVQRRRRHPVHRLRLERDPRRRRQRPRDAGAGLPDLQEREGASHPDHRGQPHRLGRAQQAGHARRSRRAARRGGDPADQAQLRLARGRQVPGARRRAGALPRRHGRAGQGAAGGLDGEVRRVPGEVPRAGRPALPDAAAPASRRAGTRTSSRSRPTPRGSRAATPPARSSTRSPRTCRG